MYNLYRNFGSETSIIEDIHLLQKNTHNYNFPETIFSLKSASATVQNEALFSSVVQLITNDYLSDEWNWTTAEELEKEKIFVILECCYSKSIALKFAAKCLRNILTSLEKPQNFKRICSSCDDIDKLCLSVDSNFKNAAIGFRNSCRFYRCTLLRVRGVNF